MAASDYTERGTGTITPVATLAASINQGALRLTLNARSAFTGSTLVVGAALLVDGEFMKLTAFDDTGVDVERGCADTIPRPHAANVPVWFIDNSVGTDKREYLASEKVGVKLLMRAGSKTMSVASAPPNDVQFIGRFARPYPPGRFRVNDTPWYGVKSLTDFGAPLALTWAHRDRVLQADVLQGHEVGNIGPEPGTTYTIDVLRADNTVVRSITGITGTSFDYSLTDAIADFELVIGDDTNVAGKLTLRSVRDGYESRDRYTVNFVTNAGVIPSGWGFSWGYGFGL